MYNEGVLTFQAGEDLAAYRRVKIETATATTPPEVVYADAGEQAIGVTLYAVDDGDMVSVKINTFPGSIECEGADTFSIGASLYAADDGKVSDVSSGTAIGKAKEACTAAGDIIEVLPFVVASANASTISYDDNSGFTTAATSEAALDEIYQHIASAQAFLNIPMGSFVEQDGTALADFADATGTTPGWSAGDEGFGIRWNNHANPDPISMSVPIPPDLNAGEDVVVHVAAAKVGATLGDAVTFTIEAFFNTVGALYDADADAGGASSAMTGNASTKTVQEVTLTLGSADVAAAPGVLTLTLQPTDGTLDTDDVIVLGVWLEYTRQILTS